MSGVVEVAATGVGTIQGAGTLIVQNVLAVNGGGTLTVDTVEAGTLTVNVTDAASEAIATGTTVTVNPSSSDGDAFDLRQGTINGVLAGNGNAGLTKSGAGIVNLNGANTYSGTTTVSAGTLNVGPAGSIASTAATSVYGGGALVIADGGSTASANITVDADGTLTTTGADALADDARVEFRDTGQGTIAGADTIGELVLNSTATGTVNVGTVGTVTATEVTVEGGVLNVTDSAGQRLVVSSLTQTGGDLDGTKSEPVADVHAAGPFDIDGDDIVADRTIIAIGSTGRIVNAATGIGVTGGTDGQVLVQTTKDIATDSGSAHGIGVTANGTGSVLVNIGGNVSLDGSSSQDAVNIEAQAGNVRVTGAGDLAGTAGQEGSDGISITTTSGDALVDVNGAVRGDPGVVFSSNAGGSFTLSGAGDVTGSGAQGVLANTTGGNGNIVVNRDGNISGSTNGVEARSTGGNGTVTVTANSGHTLTGTNAVGVLTITEGGLNRVNGDGNIRGETLGIDASVTGNGAGIEIAGAGTTVDKSGTGTALRARVTDAMNTADINITRSGNYQGGAAGILATHAGSGNVIINTGSGTIDSDGAGGAIGGTGIEANSNGGTVNVTHGGAINAEAGISASTTDNGANIGNVTVTSNADVTAITSSGIGAQGGAGHVTVTGTGTVTGGVNSDAIEAQASSSGGRVTIGGTGNTVTSGTGRAISATVSAGNGLLRIDRSGTVTGGSSGSIFADHDGTGNVQIVNTGDLTATGGDGIGVDAEGGNVVVSTAGTINGAGGNRLSSGINAFTTGSGIVTIDLGDSIGDLTGSAASANSSQTGISTLARDGKTTINVDQNVIASSTGVRASGSGSGEIEINHSAGTIHADNTAISVSPSGSGNVDINISGGVLDGAESQISLSNLSATAGDVDILLEAAATVNSTSDHTIDATLNHGSASSSINIETNTALQSTGRSAIRAFNAGSGDITIVTNADVTGGAGSAILASSLGAGANISITNGSGAIVSSANESAINISSAAGVANRVDNDGTILGFITGGEGNETINNLAGSLWVPSDEDGGASTSNLGDGTDSVNNAGTLRVADITPALTQTSVTIAGLETFNNQASGLITLQNGQGNNSLTTDRLTLSNSGAPTNYVGTAGGRVMVDTSFSAFQASGVGSDLVTIGEANDAAANGTTSGSTTLVVNDTNSGNPGAFNPIGNEVVRVENTVAGAGTDRSHFTLDGGSVDKGFWRYDLFLDDTRANAGRASADVFVLASTPDQEAHELPEVVAGAQKLFHESTLALVDRQGDVRNQLENGEEAGGMWMHAFGSGIQHERASSFTLFNATSRYNTSYDQNVYGVMGGLDYTHQGITGEHDYLMFGLFGGYIGSDLEFDASPTSVDYSGGSVGAYASYLNEGFYLDLLLKGDIFEANWDAPSLSTYSGYSARNVEGTNIGGRVGVGYKMEIGETGGYIDPFAKMSYAHTSFDKFSVIGTTVDLGDNQSLRGQIGTRIGAAFEASDVKYNLFASTAVVHEFLAENDVTLTSGATLNLGNRNEFTAVKIGAGMDISMPNEEWSAFFRADTELGDDYNAYSGKIGLNFQF